MNSHLTSVGTALANHLWQSTAFVILIWLLTLALRKNQALVRYNLWLAASIKFLIPFSLLISAGNLLPHSKQPVAPAVYSAVDLVEEPFAVVNPPLAHPLAHVFTGREWSEAVLPICLGLLWLVGVAAVFFSWWNRWRAISAGLQLSAPAMEGRVLDLLRRLETRLSRQGHSTALPLLVVSERMEPGVFGIFRPVLMWPEQLSAKLDDEHVEAIISHELMHVRRRDNLTAFGHMFVEAAFWFHPMVWWMEQQMVKEREHACDEAVVRMGGSAEIYAESLLKTCRFCIESPLTCVAGITGGQLTTRILSILTFHPKILSRAARVTLFATIAGVIAAPIALGLAHSPLAFGQILKATGRRPSFEVASIHLWQRLVPLPASVGGEQVIHQRVMKFSPGPEGAQTSDRVRVIAPVGVLIAQAYGLPPGSDGRSDGRIVGGPDWVQHDVDQYDIQAKIDEQEYAAMQRMTAEQQKDQVNLMKQSLLEDRFKLRVHFETRELPAFALVIAKGKPKLTPAKDGESTMLSSVQRGQVTELTAAGATLAQLSASPFLGGGTGSRPVIDQTGLNGRYDFSLRWGAEQGESDEPSLSAAIQEQLGLKLLPTKGPVEVIVIDYIEKPQVDGPPLHPTVLK